MNCLWGGSLWRKWRHVIRIVLKSPLLLFLGHFYGTPKPQKDAAASSAGGGEEFGRGQNQGQYLVNENRRRRNRCVQIENYMMWAFSCCSWASSVFLLPQSSNKLLSKLFLLNLMRLFKVLLSPRSTWNIIICALIPKWRHHSLHHSWGLARKWRYDVNWAK